MDDKLFLIAIGGTGMRCLESFVHLCAAGLMDNREIEILTLDTDQSNGNKDRVESLIHLYNNVKTNDPTTPGGSPCKDSFFSAKLNLYRFFTDYSEPERKSYEMLATRSVGQLTKEQQENDSDLSDLFYDRESVQKFNLEHGYRAQTHLGSMLMYHGIMEAAINAKRGGSAVKPQEKQLEAFINLLNKSSSNARVFVFGSVFGGTGASSIPVIPIALGDALRVISGGDNKIDPSKVKFGSTLLTDYFSFASPKLTEQERQKVIASSSNFALNSQAAMEFYRNDPTVRRFYKRLYHVGWPSIQKIDYSGNGDILTGGAEQRNRSHVVELMCAAAAYDFFTLPKEALGNQEAEYRFRTVDSDQGSGAFCFTGASFIGKDRAPVFENKLGALFSLAHIILSRYQGAGNPEMGTVALLSALESNYKINQYSDLGDDQAKELDNYLKAFAYHIVDNSFYSGWIYQIYQSAASAGGSFIFNSSAFPTTPRELERVDAGNIFKDDRYNWETGGSIGKTLNIFASDADKRFDTLMKTMIKESTLPYDDQGNTIKEKFLAHLFNAITEVQHFYTD